MREILNLMWRPEAGGENMESRITECPVRTGSHPEREKIIIIFLTQVCLERFRPDVEVHQCLRGHMVCGVCRPSVQVNVPLDLI